MRLRLKQPLLNCLSPPQPGSVEKEIDELSVPLPSFGYMNSKGSVFSKKGSPKTFPTNLSFFGSFCRPFFSLGLTKSEWSFPKLPSDWGRRRRSLLWLCWSIRFKAVSHGSPKEMCLSSKLRRRSVVRGQHTFTNWLIFKWVKFFSFFYHI